MILKQKALAIFDFLAAPSEKLYERAARFHFRELAEVLGAKANYEGPKRLALKYFPEVAAGLGANALENATLGAAIKTEPLAALQLLITNYESFAPKLEPVVLGSGEATYYLLKAAKEKNLYLAQASEVYFDAMLKEPFWALRHWGDVTPSDDALLARCLQYGKANKDKSAAGAYLHAYFDTDADPTDYIEAFSANPMIAYLASRHFYDRGIEFKYFGLKGLTPRWAYHFITDGFLDDEEGLIDTLLGSPDWLVEYLIESERYKDLPYISGLIDRANKKSPGHLMLNYLKLWWDRTQEHVKKLPPPKPIKIPGNTPAKTDATGEKKA